MTAKTKDMTRSQNHDDDDASFWKRFKTCDNGGASDLTHDVLFLVMMQLGFVDFLAFSGVCKSWRSFALSNRDKFMASRPPMLPMLMSIDHHPYKNECYLQDFDGRTIKTLLPYSADRRYIGLTCGYLIFLREKTFDFSLLNPITRDELYFPQVPFVYFKADFMVEKARVVLVFSPSISRWVFVMTFRRFDRIWFFIQGKGAWKYVSSAFPILDLHVFKGKIYALSGGERYRVCEMSLNPEPKLTLLEMNNNMGPFFWYAIFVNAGENLYVIDAANIVSAVDATRKDPFRGLQELDFGKMEWVFPEEKTIGKYVFFLSTLKDSVLINAAAVNLESGAADPRSQYKTYDCFLGTFKEKHKAKFFAAILDMWYFPHHECMNLIDD